MLAAKSGYTRMLEGSSDKFSYFSVIYGDHPLNETDYVVYSGESDTRSGGRNVYAFEPTCPSFYNR
jgi:hypothetical protein